MLAIVSLFTGKFYKLKNHSWFQNVNGCAESNEMYRRHHINLSAVVIFSRDELIPTCLSFIAGRRF